MEDNLSQYPQFRASNLRIDIATLGRRSAPDFPCGGLQEASPFSTLTLDIVQLRPLLLQLGLQRLRLRLQVGQSLVQLYLLCRHFRDLRGFHIFPLCGRRSAAKRLKAELTADAAAVMTSEGEDAPPVYGRGGGGGILVMLPPQLHGLHLQVGAQHGPV